MFENTIKPNMNGHGHFVDVSLPDIFRVTNADDIKQQYDKLLVTYGNWSAEMYLKILDTLNGNIREDQLNGFGQIDEDCVMKMEEPVDRAIISPILLNNLHTANGKYPKNRSYQNIFKNARGMKNPTPKMHEDHDFARKALSHYGTSSSDDLSRNTEMFMPTKKCQLMGHGVNNYLVELRERNLREMLPDKHLSLDSSQHIIERHGDVDLFDCKAIDVLIDDCLNEQLEEVTKIITETEKRPSNLSEKQLQLDDLKAAFKGTKEDILKFEEQFEEPRWRRKFVINKIEQSEGSQNTDNESDLDTGETLYCSDNYPIHKEDAKMRKIVLKPSKIPYVHEIHKLNKKLFEKIAIKWDKVVTKCVRHVDVSLTPNQRRLIADIQLRSVDPIYKAILQEINSYSTMHKKAFVPEKYRSHERNEKLEVKERNKEIVNDARKLIETVDITCKPIRKVKLPVNRGGNAQQGRDGRSILLEIMKDTERKANEETEWNKKEIAEHFAKLCSVIRSKKRPKKNQNLSMTAGRETDNAGLLNAFSLSSTSTYFDIPTRQKSPSLGLRKTPVF